MSTTKFGYESKIYAPKGKLVYEYNPLRNYRAENGEVKDLITKSNSQLNFDLTHPVEIECQQSYDGSVNLILNDNKNQPRLINTRFTAKENNTYERVDRLGNTDTNLYDESEFEIDTSLSKKYINIPKVNFTGVHYGGALPVGNYTFYFKLSDADGNETDIVAESGLVTIHMGALNNPSSIRGGEQDENSGKLVQFTLTNIDSGYDYVTVCYSRATGVDNGQRNTIAKRIDQKFRVRQSICNIHITGNENQTEIPISELSQNFFLASKAKTQAICQNMLFMGNVSKYTPDYETLSRLSQGFVPYYVSRTEQEEFGQVLDYSYTSGSAYYNVQNIYSKLGYWNEELYRFGVVYILSNGSLSPVYNIRGRNNIPVYNGVDSYESFEKVNIDYDTQIIDSATLENSAGVCRIVEESDNTHSYFKIRHFVIFPQEGLKAKLQEANIKGYFFVRQKRIPTILCQAFMIGRDTYSGIPSWKIRTESGGSQYAWVTESFLDSQGYLNQDYTSRLSTLDSGKGEASIALCPEYELDQGYFNNLFTGAYMTVKQETSEANLNAENNHFYISSDTFKGVSSHVTNAKVISIPDGTLVRDGNTIFRGIAGEPETIKFQYLCKKSNKPTKKNFSNTKTRWIFTGGRISRESYDTKNKVNIVRGKYGPFLGVYKNTTINTNSLINIYIPGYDTSQMSEYFKIRVNCEDAYYSVTDRASIKDLTDGVSIPVYRGDCYLSQFTHRLNRNFQDPDAPNNDVIVDTDTWREKYDEDKDTASDVNRGDINAVRLGTYFTFKCYSSFNLAMRDWDRGYPSEETLTGSKRSFFPLQPLRTDGHYKIPESTIYNKGFSATTGERANFLQQVVPFIKNCYQTRIIYSDIAQTDAFKNGFRVFQGQSFRDYPNQYGGITRLIEWGGNLIVIFEHAIGIAQVNQNAFIPTDDGTKIQIGAQNVLPETLTMISTDYGTQWPESVCCSSYYIYGIDTVAKKIWRVANNSLEVISDLKVQKFLNDNITLGERELTPIIGVRNVKTHYNANKGDLMFTYYDNTYGFEETVWNLCYNENQKAFVTFYSWLPSYSANIDNVMFTYDRNASKWLAKLGQATVTLDDNGAIISDDSDGICMKEPFIDSLKEEGQQLYLANRPLPNEDTSKLSYKFSLVNDFNGYYTCFSIDDNGCLKLENENKLKQLLFLDKEGNVKDPIEPCVQLNIKCNVDVKEEENYTQSGSKEKWTAYKKYNYGYYESQVVLTYSNIYNLTEDTLSMDVKDYIGNTKNVSVPGFKTDFWKHGFAGIIDVQEHIKPCYWYHKQHPFEFEFVAGNDNAGYKQFDNLILSSNNVAPESIHYTIIGDSYDFSDQKQAIYWRQEATKAFYQYNGADMLYDHKVFDKVTGYLPQMITSSNYIATDAEGNSLRHSSAVSSTYRDTLFTWIYTQQNTFNEIEYYYKKINSPTNNADYPNITGTEIVWDSDLNQFSLCNHVKARDVKEVGRTRANMQYINDKWVIQITPINVLHRNGTWIKQNDNWLPKLVVNNVPKALYNTTISDKNFPPELSTDKDTDKDYIVSTKGLNYSVEYLDGTDWNLIANSRKEVKLMDKVLKTRIRYKGDKLAMILAVVTQFNTIG